VQTYGEMAAQAGNPKASRAAGRALGANPIPIVVPCHRVIGAGGRLTGYTGGLERKVALLGSRGSSSRAEPQLRGAHQAVARGRAQVEDRAPDAVAVHEPGLAQDARCWETPPAETPSERARSVVERGWSRATRTAARTLPSSAPSASGAAGRSLSQSVPTPRAG
jgi:O-6-methylguanine DNA methyltransferase